MKALIFNLLYLFAVLFFIPYFFPAFAAGQKDVVLVNPIRGLDFWTNNFSITNTPEKQYEIIKKNKLPATWLVRYDALVNSEVQSFLKSLGPNQDVGIFFEVTPTYAQSASVKYNQSGNWHLAKSVLLTGYSPEDRVRLINTAFMKFKEVLGKTPKSVGAWWIDAYSLGYMKDKYGIEANLDVADQYSTDGYQVWGQYWSSPFYPSKLNALAPAQSEEQKLGIVTLQWATRDPFNGYGNGVFESTYSVQANDYILHNLGVDYFEKLLNIYPQTTVGLENDFDFSKFGAEYTEQLEVIDKLDKKGEVKVSNMAGFAKDYIKENPGISPRVLISADDPLGSKGKVIWYMSPKYRAGLFFGSGGVIIRDLRFYNDSNREECFDKPCENLKLTFSQSSAIDEGNFNSKWVIDDSPAVEITTKTEAGNDEVKYKIHSGIEKTITFLPDDIKIDGKVYTIPVAVMNALQIQQSRINETEFTSRIDWYGQITRIAFEAIKYLILVFVFFVIPGLIFSRNISIAISLGFILLALSSYAFGYLGNLHTVFKSNFWLWSLPILSIIIGNENIFKSLRDAKIPKFTLNSFGVSLLVLVGSIIWSLTSIKNGLQFNYGLGFWGPNGHDAIWHLSLIAELQKNVPPQNPIFGEIGLNNYHYFYDLLVAKSASLFNINVLDLVFRFFPLTLALLSGVLIYKLTFKISNSFIASFWATFFLYFGGSFGWIISYFRNGNFGGETMFWAQQSISTLLNPPFAISLVLLFAGLNIYYNLQGKKDWLSYLGLILLFGSLIEFKAYAGVLVIGSLFLINIEKIFKKDFRDLVILIGSLAVSIVVFFPNNLGSESLIEFMPLWLVNSMVNSPDRLNWYKMTITLQSGVFHKVVYANTVGILVFILGNFGTRLIGLMSFKEMFKERILSYILILSLIFPLIFIQKGNSWNIVQFLYYGLFIMAIFAGISVDKLFKKIPKVVTFGICAALIVLTIPTTLNTLTHYLPERPPAKLSSNEFSALDFLKNQQKGTVLSYPFDEKLRSNFSTPLPLSVYTSTAYVSAFSGHEGFIEDTINLEILGINYKSRINIAKEVFKNQGKSKELLAQNNISYVYLFKPLKIEVDQKLVGLKTIYENYEVKIFKVIN